MADQRGGGVREKESLNLTDTDEGIQKMDHGNGGWGGLFTPEYFKQLNSGRDTSAPVGLNVGSFDIDGDENFPGNASGETVHGSLADQDGGIISHDDDGGIETATAVSNLIGSSSSLDDLFSDLNFGNLDFGGSKIFDDYLKGEGKSECDGAVGGFGINEGSQHPPMRRTQQSAKRRIRLVHRAVRASEDIENQEFGRDTNRLDYFKVTALDLQGDDHIAGVSTHGGGTRDRGVVVGRSMEQEGGSDTDTAVAGGGIRIRRGPVRFSTNNGSESVVQRLEQERGNGGGGGRGSCIVEGPRSVEERGSVTAGASGVGGEAVVQRLKQEGATVAMPVAVVVAMAVMMMVMVVVMVVFVTLMMKMEVR